MTSEPFTDRCSNAGFDDRWTCPGCYHDLEAKRPGEMECPNCARKLRLTVEYEPISTAELVNDDEGDEE